MFFMQPLCGCFRNIEMTSVLIETMDWNAGDLAKLSFYTFAVDGLCSQRLHDAK